MLFSQLPRTTFNNKTIVDITKGVKTSEIIPDVAYLNLHDYTIEDNDRADQVSYYYYDDPSFAWLVLLPNTKLDPYYAWPLTQREFESWMIKKYGSIETSLSTILHYEHRSKNITISKETYELSASLDYINAGDYQPVYAYNHYDLINENNRHIKLISKEYLPTVRKQLKRLFDE